MPLIALCRFRRACPVLLLWALFTATGFAAPGASAARPKTYVLVHGAWGGGWAFKDVEHRLRSHGHTVYRPTLTGQGEKVHLAHPDIDLSTHITDVANVILWENLNDIVLVGHSYGGMVISGVLERVPERVQHLIYLDALVPEDGESLESAFGPGRELPGRIENGFAIPPWVQPGQPLPHDVPHPVKTWQEPVALKNPAARALPTTYILTVDPGKRPEDDTFFRFSQRARERKWAVKILEADHNPQWSKPAELVALFESVP